MAERTYKTERQLTILERYYNERSMTSKASRNSQLIEEAANESGLTIDQVKVSYVSFLMRYLFLVFFSL